MANTDEEIKCYNYSISLWYTNFDQSGLHQIAKKKKSWSVHQHKLYTTTIWDKKEHIYQNNTIHLKKGIDILDSVLHLIFGIRAEKKKPQMEKLAEKSQIRAYTK